MVRTILSNIDIGVILEESEDYEECLVCGKPVTQWIPSYTDGVLIPACDKHFHDKTITPKQWENKRKSREEYIKGLIDKECYYCGKQADGWGNVNCDEYFRKYGNDFPSDYIAEITPVCSKCICLINFGGYK